MIHLMIYFIYSIWSSRSCKVPNPDQMSAVLQLQRFAWSSRVASGTEPLCIHTVWLKVRQNLQNTVHFTFV